MFKFNQGLKSYRDLPFRIAEYGTCYRYEKSGAVSGLVRVRGMCMNDAHIYCTKEQIYDPSLNRHLSEQNLKYLA